MGGHGDELERRKQSVQVTAGRGESPGFAAAWGESGAGVCYTG